MSETNFTPEHGADNLRIQLLKKRIVPVFGKLDEKKAETIISSLLYLEDQDAEKPITLYINSEGGDETEILAVYDIMRSLSCPVDTVCAGKAHGLAALLLAGGRKGGRRAYANSEIMLFQVRRDRTFGQASDIELETAHLLESKQRITALLAGLCGREVAQVQADMERKFWLFAEQAKDYGLVDAIIETV